ncbi:MAG: hypothetical protein IJV94_02250 [Bacilli bacterium]|nr:hypothetical protein [Bacilli bacterium]
MKKFWHYLAKIHIHILTIIVYLLAFISGRFIPLLIYFSLASIHELFHILFAKIFKLKIKKIEVYPFGLSANLDSLNKVHPIKAILILIAGPCSYFLSFFIIELMLKLDILSFNSYLKSNEINELIFFFNLLPIWPLDGSKILFYLLSFFITYKVCYYIVISISFLTTILLVIFTFYDPQLVIISFLIFSQIELIIKYQFDYYKTLIFRMNKRVDYHIKIHNKKDIYLPYENFYFDDIMLLDERCLIENILHRKKE